METNGRTTDNRETPTVNRYGYPPLLGECLCGHQWRRHGMIAVAGDVCLEFVEDDRPCECALFEAAVR